MKHILVFTFLVTTFLSCQNRNETQFSLEALNDELINLQGDSVPFKSILEKHNGSTIFIDVWASWCRDCLIGLPGVKILQETYPEIDFVYLSLDKSEVAWKRGIDRLQISGEHYFMQSGRKGALGAFLGLDWIPRYLIIDKNGGIKVFNAIETTDKKLLNNL